MVNMAGWLDANLNKIEEISTAYIQSKKGGRENILQWWGIREYLEKSSWRSSHSLRGRMKGVVTQSRVFKDTAEEV